LEHELKNLFLLLKRAKKEARNYPNGSVDAQNFEKAMNSEIEGRVANILSKKHEPLVGEKKIDPVENMTSQFFVCKNIFCDGAFCLRCENHLLKEEMRSHTCILTEEDKLYFKIVDTMAEASVRSCPGCGHKGQKDLACTHMTCDKCSQRWCYICGKLENSMVGGFAEHNRWTLLTEETEAKCPMYLHYKYGPTRNGNVMNGDPLASLIAFHNELQNEALIELKNKTNNNALLRKVEIRKFGGQQLVKYVHWKVKLRKRVAAIMARFAPIIQRCKKFVDLGTKFSFFAYIAMYFLVFLYFMSTFVWRYGWQKQARVSSLFFICSLNIFLSVQFCLQSILYMDSSHCTFASLLLQ
jgi:hypothetical protein